MATPHGKNLANLLVISEMVPLAIILMVDGRRPH